jgi:CubicO group peptidase (beta-lactamase class C family)
MSAMSEADRIWETEVACKVPGGSAAVAVDARIVWSRQSGWADIHNRSAVAPDTRFRVGSVAKPLTSVGLALLVERGELDLDAPIQRYIPDYPEKCATITPRLLAGHLSGIRNYQGTEALLTPTVPNLRAGLRIFENDPLESMPGTRFAYSSYNWNVLGAVMEAAAKQEFRSFMAESVLRPLGLEGTVPDEYDHAISIPRRARCYHVLPLGEFVPARPRDYSSLWPAGGYLSTAEDLARFGSALMRPGFLKAESLSLLFTSQKTSDGKATNYGIGWMVLRGLRMHGGDSTGGTAMLLAHPASKTVVAFATNAGQVLLRNLIARGKAPKNAVRHLFDKIPVAVQLARAFLKGAQV